MGVNVRVILDKRRKKKDNTYPLKMVIIKDGKNAAIPLGYSIPEKDWDEHNVKVKRSYKGTSDIERLNNQLIQKRANAMTIIAKLRDDKQLDRISINEIKDRILNKQKKNGLLLTRSKL